MEYSILDWFFLGIGYTIVIIGLIAFCYWLYHIINSILYYVIGISIMAWHNIGEIVFGIILTIIIISLLTTGRI